MKIFLDLWAFLWLAAAGIFLAATFWERKEETVKKETEAQTRAARKAKRRPRPWRIPV